MLILGLDFETTGLDLVDDEIVEVGAVLWDTEAHQPVRIFSELVKSPKAIPPEVTELTGITNEQVKRWGIGEKEVLTQLCTIAAEADYIVAHNGRAFDQVFLEKALARHSSLSMEKPWIDTMSDLPFPDRISTRKLSYLAAEHGFLNPFAHRAVFDVLTMLKVLDQYDFKEVVQLQSSPLRRIVAQVSFDDREKAKVAGFRWDAKNRQWFLELKECQLGAKQFPFPVINVEL